MTGDKWPDHTPDIGSLGRLVLLALSLLVLIGGFGFAAEPTKSNAAQLEDCSRLLREYRQGLRAIPKPDTPERARMDICIRLVVTKKHR